ncbi:MAG: sugar ABC transporter permease [Rubrobacteraceae bacterium]|nr:sugar ABC transporter permease [Rubrobacteraceae bacterium]
MSAVTANRKKKLVAASPRRRMLRPYILSLPALIATVGILYPFVLGLYYSFTNYSASNPQPSIVGFENYVSMFSDPSFWGSVRATLIYTIGATVIETILGVGVALLLYRSTLVGRILEKVAILPFIFAPIIATIVWSLMLQPSIGVVDYLLGFFGIGRVQWTNSPVLAMISLITIDVWVFTPFVAILTLAGLRSLPKDPFEAASVDGAGYWFTFRKLTLPMVWPYILIAVIFRLLDSLQMFDIIYGLTQGGPGNSTMVLQILAYQNAILYTNFSQGITYMVLLWIVAYAITLVLVNVLNKAQQKASGPGI